MKRFTRFAAVAVLALAALVGIAPVIASADQVSYVQGQTNATLVTAGQGQVYIGFAGQTQAGATQSGQSQVTVNHANVNGLFGIPLHSVDANGANVQGQASGYVMSQGGAGLALGVQHQAIVQSQGQTQVSSGSAK